MVLNSMHTHTAGEIRKSDIGKNVTLTGWVWRRRDHGGLIFVDLRDRDGVTQCTFDPEHCDPDTFHTAEVIRSEWAILVTGTVRERPENTLNPALPTGEVEVLVAHIEVLNTSATPPFPIEDNIDTAEDVRLRYRYLDIRRPEMLRNLTLRSDFTFAIRKALHARSFIEVETPMLTKSTPEGARDFLVPSRVQPGKFYALPQSPQLLKELLMTSCIERYYQVARCFRDEDLRADRQPEFTQIDIEMSFVSQDNILLEMEEILHDAFTAVGVPFEYPLRRISYQEAMDTYGTDKPDTRFEMHLHDVTHVFKDSAFKVFAHAANADGEVVKCINAKGGGLLSRGEIDKLPSVAETFGAKGLAWIAFREDGSVNSPIVKFFSEGEMEALRSVCAVEPGDLVMFAATERQAANEILGGMRCHMADLLNVERTGHDFLWVVNFPMFVYDEDARRYSAEHHPFTQPAICDIDKIETDPLSVGSYTYDFVMDGYEAGGGGIRIHAADLQMRVLKRLGFDEKKVYEQFGFLMEALSFGAPPMGGCAFGLDRICMLLCGCDSLRDVMAFPKTSSGSDLLSDAPSEVSASQLKDVSLRIQ